MADDNDDKPNLSVVQLATPLDPLQKILADSERNQETLVKLQTNLARVRRAAYLAYVKEGFTEEQALHLCKG